MLFYIKYCYIFDSVQDYTNILALYNFRKNSELSRKIIFFITSREIVIRRNIFQCNRYNILIFSIIG